MINDEKYKELLNSGLILDHYFLLCNLSKGVKSTDSKRIQGFLNLLEKKGFIKEDKITEKGLELIKDDSPQPIVFKKSTDLVVNYSGWIEDLHKKCKDRLIELTGKGQVRDKIGIKTYAFLPNPADLGRAISRVISAYKNKDFEKMEKTILLYIDSCNRERSWFPVLQYYIWKDGSSRMITDMDDDGKDPIEEYKSRQKLM